MYSRRQRILYHGRQILLFCNFAPKGPLISFGILLMIPYITEENIDSEPLRDHISSVIEQRNKPTHYLIPIILY